MNICIATVETRNFTFEGFGVNPEEAIAALEKAMHAHAKQYTGRVGKDWVFLTMRDAQIRTVQTGTGYRDRETVKE